MLEMFETDGIIAEPAGVDIDQLDRVLTYDLCRHVTGPAYGGAVDETVDPVERDGLPRLHRRCHARRTRGLDAHDAYRRMMLGKPGHAARHESAAADRHEQYVGRLTQLLHDLAGDRTLTGDDVGGIEGRHQYGAGIRGIGASARGRRIVGLADDDQLDMVAAECGDSAALLARSRAGHIDPCIDTELLACVRHALRMIARARAHDEIGRAACRERL